MMPFLKLPVLHYKHVVLFILVLLLTAAVALQLFHWDIAFHLILTLSSPRTIYRIYSHISRV